MKKVLLFFVLCFFLVSSNYAQDDRFSQLSEQNVTGFAKPLIRTISTGINSGAFHSASVPKIFGFIVSIRGMYIMVPDDDLSFIPTLPEGYTAEPTATFWGDKGASYPGKDGNILMPNGVNLQNIPFIMPQITAGFMGTEVLLRFIPTIKAEGEEINFFGVGLKHSFSQYIPLSPVDIAAQILYNSLNFSDKLKGSSIAFNVHASKSFGIFSLYSGLQYESSTFDIEYLIEGNPNSGDPLLREDREIKIENNDESNFRFILGGALGLGFFTLNADINTGPQTVFTLGLSFGI